MLIPIGSLHPPVAHARSVAPSATVPDSSHISDAPDATPLTFIENVGQFDSDVRFQLPGGDRTIWLADDAIWVTLTGQPAEPVAPPRPAGGQVSATPTEPLDIQQPDHLTLKLSFVGADPHVHVEPINRLETDVSYFIGADPSSWRSDVPVWGGVRYAELYPGIDLVVSGENGSWDWRMVSREGANLGAVRLQVDGAEKIGLDGDRLRLGTDMGDFVLLLMGIEGLYAEQGLVPPRVGGNQVAEPLARQAPTGGTIGTADASADLLYATFFGGGDWDVGWRIAVDAAGSAYVTGYTSSSDFPAALGPGYDTSSGGYEDAFVVKLNPSGTTLVFATFLGGSASDAGIGIAVDAASNAYVTGNTVSSDFPAALGPGYDTSHNGGAYDAFVVKLNPSGTALVYATFLGGGDFDWGVGIATDGSGNAYVTGYTDSSDSPAANGPGYDTSYNGSDDAFVVKLNMSGDEIPPEIINDLTATTGSSDGTVELAWTGPGDDGNTGTASTYIVRYHSEKITDSNWDAGFDISGEPTPATAGTVQSMTVDGLTPGQLYYFAIKTGDDWGNISGISNVPGAVAKYPGNPNIVDVMLVIDRSGSMDGIPLADEKTAAKGFVDAMNLADDQVGLVSFAFGVSLDQQLTHDGDLVKSAVDALYASGPTYLHLGIQAAQAELESIRHSQQSY